MDTDASEVAIAGILCQQQIVNGETKECLIAFGSAPKAEMLAAIYFVEKYRPYLSRARFTLRTDNRALSWLKKYSMTRGMAARWIQRLDQYKFTIEHRKREKHQNVDSLSKKTEVYAQKEMRDENMPQERANFKFLTDPIKYEDLPQLEDEPELEVKMEIPPEQQVQALTEELIEEVTNQETHYVWEASDEPSDPKEWILAISSDVSPCHRECVMAIVKEHAAHRYLIRAQETDSIVYFLRMLVGGWDPKLPHEEPVVIRKVRSYYFRHKSLLYINKEGVLMRRRSSTEKPALINDVVTLPALFQMEAMRLAHDGQDHVGETKTASSVLERFDWPGLRKDVAKYINSCLTCQSSKPSKQSMKFPLKPLQSGAPNELVQIDHLKLSKTRQGNVGVLMMIDHFTKFAQALPYQACDAKETC